MRHLVISDPHGNVTKLNSLLELVNYDPLNDSLFLLGDYVDRGTRSKQTVMRVMDLVRLGAVALKGNHDDMFVRAMRNKDTSLEVDGHWLNNGGYTTLESYLGDDWFCEGFDWDAYDKGKEFILKYFSDHLDFLESLPLYYETYDHVFVHAGVDPSKKDYKDTREDNFFWIREEFIKSSINNTGGKPVIFGHTPTPNLHHDKRSTCWYNKDKIGIDGGCCFGYTLNCMIMDIQDDAIKYTEKSV